MAYVVNVTETQPAVASNTFACEVGENKENDLILIMVAPRIMSRTLSISSYTKIDTERAQDAYTFVWFWKLAGAGGETSPSCTISGAAAAPATSVCTYVIRDADLTAPIEANGYQGFTAQSGTSTELTTLTDNALVVHGSIFDGTSTIIDPPSIEYKSYLSQLFSGYHIQRTAGSIPTFTYYGSNATNGLLSRAVSVKNKSGGILPITATDGRAYLHKHGGFEATETWSKPNSVTGLTTIDGIAMGGNLATVAYQQANNSWLAPVGTALTSTENLASESWVGGFCATTVDVSSSIVGMYWGTGNTFDATRVGTKGVIIVFVDSSDNWVAYQLREWRRIAANSAYKFFVKPGETAAYDSGGPIDWSDIAKVGYFYHRRAGTTTSVYIIMGQLYTTAATSIVGGGAAWPVTAQRCKQMLLGGQGIGLFSGDAPLQGNGQLLSNIPLQFGDGTNPTYVKTTAQSIETGFNTYDWQLTDSDISVAVKGSANCTFDFSASILATSSRQAFVIHADSSTAATYSFVGCSLVGWDVTWKTGIPCTLATFSGCYEIDMKGADMTNCVISGTANTDSALTFTESGATMDGCTIDVTDTSAAYHLELGTAVTAITLADVTFTGTPGTDKVHVLKTTGTVTITISGTTTLVAGDVTSAGATVVIAAPATYQSVTIDGYTTGSRIQIYDLTNDVELYNDVPAAAPQTLWTDGSAAVADRDIRLRVAYVDGAEAEQFIDQPIGTCGTAALTAGITYLVVPLDDAVYNANAIDGSALTGYAIVGSNLTIDVSDGTATWAEMYAYQVYWLSTEDGIRDQDLFIFGIDTANYLFYGGFKIKNTSAPSVPLLVTGGNGEPSSGPATDLLDTTGGTIFCNSAIVVPYSSGAEVTEQIVRDGLTSQGYTTTRANAIDTIPEDVWDHTLP